MRLIDADELKSMYSINRANFNTVVGIQKWIDNAPTVQAVPIDVLDKIRAEIDAIEVNGQVDEHTMFIRTGEQVKQMALNIVDKYKAESEEA